MGRRLIVRWGYQAVTALIASALSILVYQKLLTDRAALLPSGRGLTDQLWIVVIGFVYLAIRSITWPTLGKSDDEKRNEYLHAQYKALRDRFGFIVSQTAASRPAEAIAYAVMLYESFNRPALYQWFERHFLHPSGYAHTLGPMQVTTDVLLSDEQLVRLGVERINEYLAAAMESVRKRNPEYFQRGTRPTPIQEDAGLSANAVTYVTRFEDLHRVYQSIVVEEAASHYNVRSDYPRQVSSIFQFLRRNYYSDILGPASQD